MLSLKKSLNILKKTDALLEGHFILSSGLHSSKYIQCAKLLSFPFLADQICKSLASKIKYIYKLTPHGIAEKTKLTINFMNKKMKEYEDISNIKRPTTGFNSILWGIENYDKVIIHGFDFFENGKCKNIVN